MFGHNPLTYGNIGNLLHRAETKIFMGTQYDQDTTDTSMDVRIKWDYATESYHWIASPYTNWQDTGVTKANQVKTVDTEQDGAVSGGIQRHADGTARSLGKSTHLGLRRDFENGPQTCSQHTRPSRHGPILCRRGAGRWVNPGGVTFRGGSLNSCP